MPLTQTYIEALTKWPTFCRQLLIHFYGKKIYILIHIHWFVSKRLNGKPSLVRVKLCCRLCDVPFKEANIYMYNIYNIYVTRPQRVNSLSLNTLRPRQNSHVPDDIFKLIFVNENAWISIKISLKFVPSGPINNIRALVQTMAWRRPGAKPLSEPMMA